MQDSGAATARSSDGRRRLVEVLRGSISRGEIARLAQVSRRTVGYWVCGDKKPQYHARKELLRHLGIPMDAWEQPAGRTAETPSMTKAA